MYIERKGKEQRLQEQIPKKRGAIQEKKSKAIQQPMETTQKNKVSYLILIL